MSTNISMSQPKLRLGALVGRARKGHSVASGAPAQTCPRTGLVESPARKLTDAWRERRKHIRLNRPGQKRLTIAQLIQNLSAYDAGYVAVAKSRDVALFTKDDALAKRAPKTGVTVMP